MKNNKIVKAGIWYTICNFLVKGLTFLTMPIFTRLMSSSDIGMFSNISSWFNILAIITSFELYSSISIARFDFKDELNEYISSSLVLGNIITIFFYMIVIIFRNFFLNLFNMNFETLNLIFIYLLVYPSIQMFQLKNQIKYNYKPTIIVTLLSAFFSTILSILFVLLFDNKLMGRVYGYYIPLIIISFIVYIYMLIKSKKVSKKYWNYALKISFPLIWHLLAGYLLSSSDKIMITNFIGADANALYSVPYTLSMVVSVLWTSMNNAWSPWAYSKMDEKNYEILYTKSKSYTIFFLIIVYIFILVTPELLLVVGGKYYAQAKYVMPPVMIGYILQFIYSLYVNIEFYHKKQKNIAFGTILASIINIILNLIFIPKFGYIAAAYTTLIGYLCLYLIHFYFVRKLNCTFWYDTKFFFIVTIVSITYMFFCNIVYEYTIIRYLLVVILFVFLIIYLYKYNYIKLIKQNKIKI